MIVVLQGRNTAAWEHPWLTMVRMASLSPLLGSPVIKIHSYVLEGSSIVCCGDLKKWNLGFVGKYFVLLADGASFDVFCDPLGHMWP